MEGRKAEAAMGRDVSFSNSLPEVQMVGFLGGLYKIFFKKPNIFSGRRPAPGSAVRAALFMSELPVC